MRRINKWAAPAEFNIRSDEIKASELERRRPGQATQAWLLWEPR